MVRWVDSSRSNFWGKADDLHVNIESLELESIGYLVKEDEDCLTVAGHIDPQEKPHYDGAITIPRIAITGFWRLVVS